MEKVQHSTSLFLHTQTSFLGLYVESITQSLYLHTVIHTLTYHVVPSNFPPNWRVVRVISVNVNKRQSSHKDIYMAAEETAGNHLWMCGNGREVDMGRLKKEVESCSKLFSSSESSECLLGSQRFYHLIMSVWALDTCLAMDAAEMVCTAIRCGLPVFVQA